LCRAALYELLELRCNHPGLCVRSSTLGSGVTDREDFPPVTIGLHEIEALAAQTSVDLVVRLAESVA